MEAYRDFASVYDIFMEGTPYEEWCACAVCALRLHHIEDGLVLELGCGTGSFTELLAKKGYDMIGIDSSEEMLNEALIKRERSGQDILYLQQDMREFELYGTVRAVVSVCASINYILDEKEMIRVFKLVNNYLDPEGIFFFDFNTDYTYRQVMGDTVTGENRKKCSYLWENYFCEEEGINACDLTVFVKERGERYRRFRETHYQKGYTPEKMKRLIEKAGLALLDMRDADTGGQVTQRTQRVWVTAGEKGKVGR